ncbi:DUF350 domain-containing protein [Sphingomonas sp. HF-S3]|uniref:DUF350 domain-containing protein n=1 Tax=Sphingomonas rustica TaxID=3103142 RepID=A0ABV0BH26_9SPHN
MATTLPQVLATLIYSGLGMVVFVVGFIILDLLTPGKLWEEIKDKQNLAVAAFAGMVAIALAIIVAAAIHG